MTYRKYIRLLLVLLLPLLAAGVIFVEFFSNLRTQLLAMQCDNISCTALTVSSRRDAQNAQWDDWYERNKGINIYDISTSSLQKQPNVKLIQGRSVTFSGEIISISDKFFGITQENINKYNYFKQFEGKMTAIELRYKSNKINSCQHLNFTDDGKIIEVSCNEVKLDVNLSNAEDFNYFKKLKENIFKEEEEVLKNILINRLIGYSLPLLLFLASSLVIFLTIKAYRFVKAG